MKEEYLQLTEPKGMAAVRVSRRGERVFLGNVLPVDPDGRLVPSADIQAQTHAAFQRLRESLQAAGADMADLVRINTYYVYNGPEQEATRYWEGMTRVRLQYFVDPGPVGTAVRVVGTGLDGALIQLEAEALLPRNRGQRQRIMPTDSWDWSVPVPLSQGWRQSDYVWVGGQVCADRKGRAQHVGNLKAQTETVLRYIGNVIRDASALPEHLLHLKICYLHDGDQSAAQERLDTIMSAIYEAFGEVMPAVTAFGVNLLYEGLLLEIDASAVVDSRRSDIVGTGADPGVGRIRAALRGQYIQTAGFGSCAEGASLQDQVTTCLRESIAAVEAAGGSPDLVARVTAFISAPAARRANLRDPTRLLPQLEALLPRQRLPAMTVSLVEGLPKHVDVQVDVLACLEP
jgi:enamine deaminase RidA (YjgF/YER057c/UK114 family)